MKEKTHTHRSPTPPHTHLVDGVHEESFPCIKLDQFHAGQHLLYNGTPGMGVLGIGKLVSDDAIPKIVLCGYY